MLFFHLNILFSCLFTIIFIFFFFDFLSYARAFVRTGSYAPGKTLSTCVVKQSFSINGIWKKIQSARSRVWLGMLEPPSYQLNVGFSVVVSFSVISKLSVIPRYEEISKVSDLIHQLITASCVADRHNWVLTNSQLTPSSSSMSETRFPVLAVTQIRKRKEIDILFLSFLGDTEVQLCSCSGRLLYLLWKSP